MEAGETRLAPPPARGPAAYIGELIGTFGLVFFVTASISLYITPASAGGGVGGFLWVALVHFFVLFVLIQTLAIVSGAHFNPAVTVAMTVLRQIRPPDALIYVIVQLTGAILGALLTRLLLSDEGSDVAYGATFVSEAIGGSIGLAMISEAVGTFFLVWAIVGVAVNPHSKAEWAGLAIGASLGLVVFIFGPLTGAGVNPARSFGPALVAGDFGGIGTFLLVYVLAPVIGALLAALAYGRMFIARGKKGMSGAEPVG